MPDKHNIKRGVSLYSFQEEYFLRTMGLEDALATLSELGAYGVEIIGDQMIPGYPNISDEFYKKWDAMLDQYQLTPTCLDMFLDWNKYKGRAMTDDEKVASIMRDIDCANRLGCTVIRVITHTEPKILERVASYAEKKNVRLGVEIHSPFHLDHEYQQSLLGMYERVQSPSLGFVPDMGIFVKTFPRVVSERWVRNGVKPEIADAIVASYNRHNGMEGIREEVLALGGTESDVAIAKWAGHYIYTDPRRLLDFMPYLFHIHAKFYEMLPTYREYSIPYEDVVPVLIEGGFDGYLSSEYEGNRHIQDAFEVDSVEQVRRQQVMFKELLGEA